MFKSFTTENALPVSNSEPTEQLKPSNYSWKTLTKAGLVFVTTTSAFCALKTTGSFSLISSWLKNKGMDFDDQETKLAVHEGTREIEAYSGYSDFKESSLAAVKDSHEHIAFMPQKAKRSPTEILEKIGPEFQVNTYTPSDQWYPSVAGLSDGKFVVTWDSYGQDGDRYGIYGQMFNADGGKYLSEFQANTYTTNNQWFSSVAGLSDGKFVVTWHRKYSIIEYYICGQMFNADGGKYLSEFQVNMYGKDDQGYPSVAGLSDGKFVVTWHTNYGMCDIRGQMFNADGSKYSSEFQVNTYTTSYQEYPSVAGLSDGKFVVTWANDGQDGSGLGVYGQIFNINGTKFLSEFQVNTYTTNGQYSPSIARLSNSKFVVAWHSDGQDGNGDGVFGQMYNADGGKYLSEFRANTYTTNNQWFSSVAGLSDGKFVVTWASDGQDGSGLGVYGQMFNADGSKYSSEFQVNTYTANSQQYPSIAGLSDGKFVVTWTSNGQDGSNYGVYGQMFWVNDTFASSYLSSSQQIPESSSEVSSYSPAASSFGTSDSSIPTSDQSQRLSSVTQGTGYIGTIIGIIIGGTSLVLCIVGGTVGYLIYRKNKKVKLKEIDLEEENISIPREESKKERMSMLADDGSVKTSLIIPYKKLKLGQKVGGGGSGIVYKGRWQHTDVAIKQLHSIEFDPHAKIEFNREVTIMAALRHTNIVSLFGICFEPECCIVMEYMEGGSLYGLLHSNEELTWSSRLHMAMDITKGLAYLHERDIVHRDLKSLNVLLSKDRRAKLTDFGLSKEKTGMAGTMTKGLIGTARWIAPELMDVEKYEREGYTKKTDVYSYGMILYELSSRQVPFQEDENEMIVMKKVDQGSRPKIPEDCPEVYGILLSHCWRQRSEARPDINTVIEALEICCEELPAEETAKCSTNGV